MRLFVTLFTALLVAGCAGSGSNVNGPETAGQVDLERYQGSCYEQARLPMFSAQLRALAGELSAAG